MTSASLRHAGLSLLISAALSACATAPGTAPAEVAVRTAPAGAETGEIAGAPYRMEIPANWNGDLVMYLHGYEAAGMPRDGQTEQDAFDRWLLGEGYAVARSSYSKQGWAIAEALVENEALRRHFVARYGAPRRSFAVGHSMGAHLVLATLEKHPGHYDGGLALCGANAPAAELFNDGLLPPLLAFDYFFPGAMGLPPGGLADPAGPAWLDQEALEKALAGDEARANLIATRFDIPRGGLAGGLMIRHAVVRELAQRAGGFPLDNRGVRYTGLGDDDAFNAGVRRYTGDPAAMAYAAANAPLTGRMEKPVVLLANNADPTIPPSVTRRYADLAAQAGRDANVLLLPPQGEGHCGFPLAAVDEAMEKLAAWAASGQRPAASGRDGGRP